MLLGENYKKRLLELAGIPAGQNLISEADKRNVIIQKIKFPPELSKEIADWAHNISEKYSIWVADSLKKKLIEGGFINQNGGVIGSNPDDDGKYDYQTRSPLINDIRGVIRGVTSYYTPIIDWLTNRNTLAPEHDQLNFKTLTLADAIKRSEEWHNNLKAIQGGKIEGEEGDIVMTFPEGFYWISLGKAKCEKEASAMGHCGTGRGNLYSLRKEQYPYVTADVTNNGTILAQMKGRANTKPKASFHKYIIPFILHNSSPLQIEYASSSYQPHTDFNIKDLSDADLKNVVSKKPSLLQGDGWLAFHRLSDEEVMNLLINHSKVILALNERISVSDILRNNDMINWAIQHLPKIFVGREFGNDLKRIKLDNNQLIALLNNKEVAADIDLDGISVDENAFNWIIKNKPELLSQSIRLVQSANDEQKDFLVKNHPSAFMKFLSMIGQEQTLIDNQILSFLGPERLQKLFSKNPELFNVSKSIRNYNLWQNIITPKLMSDYIIKRSLSTDTLGILNNSRKFQYFIGFVDNKTAMFVLVHYPELFFESGLMKRLNSDSQGADELGRYVFDHHFDWIEKYDEKLEIQNWNLTNVQKQYIIDYDNNFNTNILSDFNLDESAFRKLEFSLAQKKQILKIYKEGGNLSLDMILGFDLTPESAKKYILNVLENNEDESNKLVEKIEDAHGEEYINKLYKENPEAFPGLLTAVKYRDVERLKKHNDPYVSYGENGIKIRFDEWSDDELIDLFKDSREGGRDLAKSIANYELDFYGYDYKFGDVDGDFNELDQVNTAKVRYLLSKAFPPSFKKQIMAMNHSQLVDILSDPDSISEEPTEYDGDIVDGIKDAFVRTMEDAQQSADESEYWKLYTEPIEKLLGKPKWADIKLKKKGTNDIEQKQVLEFEISYDELESFIKDAEQNSSYNYGDDFLDVKNYATSLRSIIKSALEERGDELDIDTPYYGVSGDRNKEDINERFPERLSDHSDLSSLLDKAKIVVKRQPKKK